MKINEYLGDYNTLGQDIWTKKYQRNEEDFEGFLNRITGGNESIAKLIREKKFIYAGRILANRGMQNYGKKITYSNCYATASPEDNIESIFETAKKLARTYSYGGGCGTDIGKLRPRGAAVNNAAETTTGAVSFMDLFSLVTKLIGSEGRRGALMISIPCTHPDLEEFITVKSDLDKVTTANISVRITDEFMKAVKNRTKFMLEFKIEHSGELIQKKIDAYDMFCKLCDNNWDYAEPGLLYWDNIEKWNLLANTKEFEFATTNPCAEEPLPAGGSCLLSSINLAAYINEKTGKFDFEELGKDVRTITNEMNIVLDEGLPLHPLEEQREAVKRWRQVGIGVLGIADMLIKLNLRYGSEKSVALSDKIGKCIADNAIYESATLAKKDGAYPGCNIEEVMDTEYFKLNTSEDTKKHVEEIGGLRNSQLLTIAPTGTISTMLGISGGIEPIFANSYTRKTESLHGKDVYYKVYTPIVEKYMKDNNIPREEDLPDFFVTSPEIPYKERIAMQSTWQKHIDASISSTVNVPFEFSKEEVRELYIEAWEAGLKGITIFRDGCKRVGILSQTEHTEPKRGEILKLGNDSVGKRRTLHTGCGTLHCEAFFDKETGELRETFLSKGSNGGCNSFMVGLSRMISLAARGGIGIDDIVDQLKSTMSCTSYVVRTATKHDTSKGNSCPMAVANALIEMHLELLEELDIKEQKKEVKYKRIESVGVMPDTKVNNPCPVCGEELIFEGGCNTCKSCGYSKCE